MRESSHRQKKILKGSLDPKRPITDYQQYEDQLASYQRSSKAPNITNLFDWSKPSEIISLNPNPNTSSQQPPKDQPLQNNSMNTEELLRSEGQPREKRDEYFDDSYEVESPRSSPKPTFADRVQHNYGGEYLNMSCSQIEEELRAMREQMITMNDRLNRMLDRYELLSGRREAAANGNLHQVLTKEVELNARILNAQAEQIRQIQEKDKELEKKDYLVQLNELIIEIGKEIHDTSKEKYNKWVDVERIDRLLKQLQEVQGSEDQFRQVKELKVRIVFYFKKLKEHKMQEEELDLQMEKLLTKDKEISRQLDSKVQLAVQHSLEVSTNKEYLQLKKRYYDLVSQRDSAKKKKDIATKFQIVAEDKLEREIKAMRRELERVEAQTQEMQERASIIQGETTDFINHHNVLSREIKSISYRFDDSLIHSSNKFKPDFRRINKADPNPNTTLHTPSDKTSMHIVNDKNLSIDDNSSNAEHSNLRESKLKPVLRQWKGKSSERPRYVESPSNKDYKTIDSSNIFRPPLLLKHKK